MKLGPRVGVAVLHSPSGPSRSDFAAAVAAAMCSATAAGSAFWAWVAEMASVIIDERFMGYLECAAAAAFAPRHCERSEAIQFLRLWIASRNLSSGAHSRDPLARNDDRADRDQITHCRGLRETGPASAAQGDPRN